MFHRVYDNLIPKSLIKSIAEQLQDVNTDWHWRKDTIGTDFTFKKINIVETPQFVHTVFPEPNGPNSNKLFPMMQKVIQAVSRASGIEVYKLSRIKANLITQHADYGADCHHTPHCDVSIKNSPEEVKDKHAISLIYYPVTCDGVTRIFDTFLGALNDSEECMDAIESANCVEQIQAIEGRCVLLPSSLLHASSPPTKAQRRMVINSVFYSNRGLDPKFNVTARAA